MNQNSGSNFYISHLTDRSGCDIRLTVTEMKQYITTEGYPDSYLDNQNCSFDFEAPSGWKILVFFEDVDLEIGYDYVVFRKSHTCSSLFRFFENIFKSILETE